MTVTVVCFGSAQIVKALVSEMRFRGVALVDTYVVLEQPAVRLAGPLAVAVVWVREDPSLAHRLAQLCSGALAVPSELGFWFERVLLLTNLDGREAERALAHRFPQVNRFVVLGAGELGDSLDRRPELRAAMPSVLGLRDLEPLIAPEARERSSLDIAWTRLHRLCTRGRIYGRRIATTAILALAVLTLLTGFSIGVGMLPALALLMIGRALTPPGAA